jgi:hypothetical protein
MNVKVIGTLLSMAFVAVVVYLTALFNVAPLHAATVFVFPEVIIEDGALIAQNLNANIRTDVKLDTGLKANVGTPNENASATATAKTTQSAGVTVSSTTDLDLYTRTVTEQDASVENVVVKEDSVAVSYREPAKILGFIPTELIVTVEVENNGTVSVRYPWYAFLAGKNAGELKPGLQLHIGDILKNATTTSATATTTASATTTEKLSPQVRAELIKAIHTALKEYRMNAGATTTVNVNY